uniref:Early lactation protein n=1 Tax=Phascolarctos cinereus TaxID=38626 RepID=A0A6P5IJI0_PHACI|nr:kunitz-type protease inhibitor 4 isoform X2 [Phascolarctos cinereus]
MAQGVQDTKKIKSLFSKKQNSQGVQTSAFIEEEINLKNPPLPKAVLQDPRRAMGAELRGQDWGLPEGTEFTSSSASHPNFTEPNTWEVLWAGQLVPGHPDMKNLQQACSLLVVQWPFCRTVLWSQGAHWEALEDPEPSGEETCCSGKSKSTWVQSPPRTVTTSLTSGDLPASIPEICTLPQSIGSCRGSFPRYYYNKFARRCERFLYGGCGGNRNNFIFVEQCQLACRENK